jgi:molecular chaperone GrpE
MIWDNMSDDKKPFDDMMPPMPATPSEGSAPAAAAAQMGEPEISAAQFKGMIAALQGELDKKAAEVAEKHDLYVRAVAETENVRRRMEKDKEETAKYAITKFARDILGVGDSFHRAVAAVPAEATENDPVLKSFLQGVILAERDFQGALEKNGVRVIDPAGQPFNPHHHQAVMEQANPDVPAGTVIQVFQVGYLIDDRCLRPAMVVVSKGGPKAVKPNETA